MNDGDIGDAIEEHVVPAETSASRERKFENDEVHLDPSRWWFASSAFPMIAGTLGPVANAFSICALVRPWRQYMPPGQNIESAPFVDDPVWLLVVNAIQLVLALVSNVFLLLNMTRRVRFSVAQPITIVGWYISAICLVSLNATAAGPLKMYPESEYVLSQAFWYGTWAAILYFIVASLMVVTVYGAHTGHYDRDFMLTTSQRTLMLQTIMFLFYLLIGALVFSKIEGWPYLDGVYWADVTLFTVGFGDYVPTTNLGRALLFPYALIGVISLGLVIGSIRSLVLERGKRRLDARMVEKKRRLMIRKMTNRGKDQILKPIQDEETAPSCSPDELIRSPNGAENDFPQTEYDRRHEEFKLMRKIQHQASWRRRWFAMATSTSTWLVLWMVGAKIFQEAEAPYQGWTYFDGFYFTFVTLTTIGYGDRTPVSPCGKSFFVFWSLMALPTMTVLISNAGDTVVKAIRDVTIQLGNVTILPGEKGFTKDIKSVLHSLSCGVLFGKDENVEELVPGFIGDAQSIDRLDADSDEEDAAADADADEKADRESRREVEDASGWEPAVAGAAHSGREQSTAEQPRARQMMQLPSSTGQTRPSASAADPPPYANAGRRSRSLVRDPAANITRGPEYEYILICEIAAVTKHMRDSPPRRYTFVEWAWYLKLIGEDESSSAQHLAARPHVHHKKSHQKNAKGAKGGSNDKDTSCGCENEAGETKPDVAVEQWSWVGSRSPLMGSQEESEWILERLTERLKEELAAKQGAGVGGSVLDRKTKSGTW